MMKFIFAACFVLCIGVVYGQTTTVLTQGWPQVPANRCYAWNRWVRVDFNSLASTTNSAGTKYYYGCRLYRTTYSQCQGGCSSHVGLSANPFSYRSSCQCCKPDRIYYIRPALYCRYVVVLPCGGSPYLLQNQYVTDHPISNSYAFYYLRSCSCQTCNRKQWYELAAAEEKTAPQNEEISLVDQSTVDLGQVQEVQEETEAALRPVARSESDGDRASAMLPTGAEDNAKKACPIQAQEFVAVPRF